MGMFDEVTYEAPCPFCGAKLTKWQSKSGGCGLQHLTPQQLWGQRHDPYYDDEGERPGITFYGNCGGCGTWVEIHLTEGTVDYTKEDFKRQRAGESLQRQRGPVFPAHPLQAQKEQP